MSDLAIRVENLSKQYTITHANGRHDTLRDAMASFASRMVGRFRKDSHSSLVTRHSSQSSETFWALRDVSFEIKRGEVVGIIGRNGAGKSTLLKILSRITDPTSGRAEIYGRVGSLLEVGTGFHPELTGRENIYLNGAILGMRKEEIKRKFDEIVAFSEIERFIDTPVKHYSSGMYVRLAFAVAAHLEPEILIVDEVLAVGDASFQSKCLGKMGDVAREGRTVLFVSHNMTAVQSFCSKAVWLDKGRIDDLGPVRQVVGRYLRETSEGRTECLWDDPTTAPGNDSIKLRRVQIRPRSTDQSDEITVRTPIDLEFQFWNGFHDTRLNLSMVLYDLEGTCVLNSVSVPEVYPDGLISAVCCIPSDLLNDTTYRVRLLVVKDASMPLIDLENVGTFKVHDAEREVNWFGKWVGVVRPQLEWRTEIVTTQTARASNP